MENEKGCEDVKMTDSALDQVNGHIEERENIKMERATWGTHIEFTLSCVGFSVGIGNLWRFPYLCVRNGGGAFLIPYFLFLVLCGLPLYYMELILGQFAGLGPLGVWRLCPLFKGIGWCMIVVSAVMSTYYNIIISWVLYYFGMSMRAEVPWKNCNNEWNTENCTMIIPETNYTTNKNLMDASSPLNYSTHRRISAAEEFWHHKVLDITAGIENLGGINWEMLVCLTAAWITIFMCLCKGIKSSGKAVYVTATVPYVFLTILLVRGVTLPGSLDGVKYYLIPDWRKLLSFKVWTDACLQVFFSLGPAWGGLINMASYNKFNNNCLRDTIIVCMTCGVTSFFAGFVIFPIIGFMAHELRLPMEKVISQGPGLAFIAYPEAIEQLPISPFWAVCFFLVLLTLGLDSEFVTLETVISGIIDQFPELLRGRRTLFTFFVCVAMYIVGFPLVTRGGMYVFQIVDWYAATFSVVVIAFFECIVVCYIYGIGRFYDDVMIMIQYRPSFVWAVTWCGVTPLLLLTMLIVTATSMVPPMYGEYVYPWWANMIGWIISSLSILPLPIVAVYMIVKSKGTLAQRIVGLLRPDKDWGPSGGKQRDQYKHNRRSFTWVQRMRIRELVNTSCDEDMPDSAVNLKMLN